MSVEIPGFNQTWIGFRSPTLEVNWYANRFYLAIPRSTCTTLDRDGAVLLAQELAAFLRAQVEADES